MTVIPRGNYCTANWQNLAKVSLLIHDPFTLRTESIHIETIITIMTIWWLFHWFSFAIAKYIYHCALLHKWQTRCLLPLVMFNSHFICMTACCIRVKAVYFCQHFDCGWLKKNKKQNTISNRLTGIMPIIRYNNWCTHN